MENGVNAKEISLTSQEQEIADRSVNKLKEYISSKDRLSYEATLWLFRKHHSRRTPKDIRDLVDSNLAMVYSIAAKFHKKHTHISNGQFDINFTDMFNAGVVGLNQAIEKYESSKGTKFSTYAYHWISAHIRTEIKKNLYPLKTYSYTNIHIEELDDKRYDDTSFFGDVYYNDLLDAIKEILDEQEYDMFTKYFVEGKSMAEISDIYGNAVSTVQYWIRKIRTKLEVIKDYKN